MAILSDNNIKLPNKAENQILFPAFVVDNNDPMMLGRCRVVIETNSYSDTLVGTLLNESKLLNSPNEVSAKDKWTINDPFVFLPLLPFYIYQVPKVNEYVHVIFQNKNFPDSNRFYIQGPLSSPMTLSQEYYQASKKFLASGARIQDSLSIKNPNGTYKEKVSFGVFPEPGDNSFMGRGSTDLILKENEVLLRAGKTTKLIKSELPKGNDKRAFLQLSLFKKEKKLGEPIKVTTSVQNSSPVKKMIVWNINNLENSVNVFNGSVGLYNVLESNKTSTLSFKRESILDLSVGVDYVGPTEELTFTNDTIESLTQKINKFTSCVINQDFSSLPGYTVNSLENVNDPIPLVVTPSKITYQKGNVKKATPTSDEQQQASNFNSISNKISINKASPERGFFLVSGINSENPIIGPTFQDVELEYTPTEYVQNNVTYGVLGAQRLYLMSQDARGPKGVVNLSETLYGIPQDNFVGNEGSIRDLTYPTVRGDILMQLLSKIFSFVTGHVHPAATLPPSSIASGNGQSTQEINAILANNENTILNQNIRIN